MNARGILDRIRETRPLVVGDICLDRWCRYDPALAEASRETGIPRIGVVAVENTPGAAGTVANNLVALGAKEVSALGAIGDDGFGFELRRALGARGISSELSLVSPDIATFTYTKLINVQTGEEDLPRVDNVNSRPLPEALDTGLIERLRGAWSFFDVVLVSDQAETDAGGVITARMRSALADLAAASPAKVVWVDSRMRAELFRNVTLKCNDAEAEAAAGRAGTSDLRRYTRSRLLVVTHGKRGALVIDDSGERSIPTRTVEKPVDICGAGDSFSAGAALALSVGASPEEAVKFGNMVASVTIMKKGTGTASRDEVLAAERQWGA